MEYSDSLKHYSTFSYVNINVSVHQHFSDNFFFKNEIFPQILRLSYAKIILFLKGCMWENIYKTTWQFNEIYTFILQWNIYDFLSILETNFPGVYMYIKIK